MQLLESLAKQEFSLDRFEVIVVDNDKTASARQVVMQAALRYPALAICYDIEPTPGISYARNKTVELARGELLAFIDDDEWAVSNWLEDMATCLKNFNVDAVLGPVIPQYPEGTHAWVIKSQFFERPRFPTGTSITAKGCRTSNALVSALKMKSRRPNPFEISLALSGGEDTDFFNWLETQGGKFTWCDTAAVNEVVPRNRQTLSFIFERCFRTSAIYWRKEYTAHTTPWAIRKATMGALGGIGLFFLGSAMLPFNMAKSVRFWSKGIKGFGRVAALTKVVLIGYGEKSNG